MNQPIHPHAPTAPRGASRVGAVWLDSGITAGLVVVDSNRPAIHIVGGARGLLAQSGVAH